MNRKHEEYWQSNHEQKQVKGFLIQSSAIRAGQLLNLSGNQLPLTKGLPTGHCHLKELCKLGLVKSPECERCKQASEKASHVLCDCEALAALRFRHLA